MDAQARDRRNRLVEAAGRFDVAHADPEVVDAVFALALASEIDGLRAVAVGIADEGAVVVGVVLRPRAGRPVVGVAGGRHRTPPLVDRLARARDERDVQVARDRPVLARGRDREVLPLEEMVAAGGLAEAESEERELVEATRTLEVRDADRDVVEQPRELRTGYTSA